LDPCAGHPCEPRVDSCVWVKPCVLRRAAWLWRLLTGALSHSEQEWVQSSGHRREEGRLPQSQTDRQALAEVIGRDGSTRFPASFAPDTPAFLREIPAV